MRKLILSAIILVIGALQMNGQDNTIVWQNTIGGSDLDVLGYMNKTSDGGFILAAQSTSNISGDKTENNIGERDYWVIKLDSQGDIEWQNTIGGDQEERLREIEQTADGGYILGGYSESGISGDKTEESKGGADYWVIKLNTIGEIEWQKTIGGAGDDFLRTLSQTSDGGYIAGGDSDSNISGDKTENSIGFQDYWVVKLDVNGNIEWENTVGGNLSDLLYDVKETFDGGYVLGGGSESFISGDKTEDGLGQGDDYWVVKLNELGVVVWDNTIGGNSFDTLISIAPAADGGFALIGSSVSDAGFDKTENSEGDFDYWVVKISDTGVVEWDNTIGGNSNDSVSYGMQLQDESYMITGYSSSYISGDKTENPYLDSIDYWIVNIGEDGNLNWENTIGGDDTDVIYGNLLMLDNGNLLIGGTSISNASFDKTENSQVGSFDLWILEVSGDPSLSVETNLQDIGISIFPNPTAGILNIEMSDINFEKIAITNALGNTVKSFTEDINQIDVSDLADGVYFINIEVERSTYTTKIIKR